MNTSKNLGVISSIKTSTTPPNNKQLLWLDTNTTPPIKKGFDVETQQWLEVVFLSSPANVVKRLITITPNADSTQDTYNLQNEDLFIKTNNGNVFLNIPEANANYVGKVIEVVNMSENGVIFFNYPIKVSQLFDSEQVPIRTNYRIICVLLYGQYNWTLISKTNL